MSCRRVAASSSCWKNKDDIEVTGVARDGREAVGRIRESRPDLMFLDIQMPNVDGFGVLQAVGHTLMPVTIFVTAYDAFAIRVLKCTRLTIYLSHLALSASKRL